MVTMAQHRDRLGRHILMTHRKAVYMRTMMGRRPSGAFIILHILPNRREVWMYRIKRNLVSHTRITLINVSQEKSIYIAAHYQELLSSRCTQAESPSCHPECSTPSSSFVLILICLLLTRDISSLFRRRSHYSYCPTLCRFHYPNLRRSHYPNLRLLQWGNLVLVIYFTLPLIIFRSLIFRGFH